MRQRAPQTSGQRVDRSFVTVQRLLLENARLSRLCAQNKRIAARYELLLREGDHRIKNSLHVVASLLGRQARIATDAIAKVAIQAAAARIIAVARIHDALQLSSDKDLVDVGGMIETMCKSLHAMAGDPLSIKIVVNAEPIQAPIALAQPIVLTVNELILNALRHAFPHDRGGTVLVTVTKCDDQLRIEVTDDGIGLPAHYAEGNGYGLTLVRAMTAKVGGSIDVGESGGARFTLSVPLPLGAMAPSLFDSQCAPQLVAAD